MHLEELFGHPKEFHWPNMGHKTHKYETVNFRFQTKAYSGNPYNIFRL